MGPAAVVVLFSILVPAKGWVSPDQPLFVDVDAPAPINLVLTDFTGKPADAEGETLINCKKRVDVKKIFRAAGQPVTSILYAIPQSNGNDAAKFVGTPLVIDVRDDNRPQAPAGAMVTRVMPLQYASISTDK